MKSTQEETEFLTADQAKIPLQVTTREGVIYMIKHGQLPGARKISSHRNSPWQIPMSAIKAHPNYTPPKKRGQPAKTD